MKLCAFDIETRGRNPEFVCGAIFSDATSDYFADPKAMIEAMRAHARKGYTFVAHHAEYDATVLLWGQGEDVSLSYANNLFSTGRWRFGSGRRTAPIWDSMRLCAGLSLEALGTAIGIPKWPIPKKLVEPDDWRRDWVCDVHSAPGCLQCYVTRDAEIVWSYCNALREWLEAYGLSLHNSLSRSAMDLWRLLDPGQQQSLRSKELLSLARMAYHGGRCEPFQYGNVGRVYTADIRSCYGAILRDIWLPSMGSLRYSDKVSSCELPPDSSGVVEATVRIGDQYVPPLPVEYHDRIYYPVGTVTGAWPIPELREALRYGVTIKRIHRMTWTDELFQPFEMTAGTLLALREGLRNQNDARELVAKHMLNAIPGRLGMREVSERSTFRRWQAGMRASDMNGADIESEGNTLYLVTKNTLTRASKSSNVLWAAIILGEARARLNRYLRAAGTALLYCDTDSVHSLDPLPIEGDSPGLLRDTGVYDTGVYLGAKFYSLETFEGKHDARAKGIPRAKAAEFVANRHVAYQTALGVADGILRGIKPCVWVDVDRVARYAPGTRTILEPGVLSGQATRSATAPVVFASVEDSLTSMDTRSMIDTWNSDTQS